ncbi:MAG: hypothetical protein ACE5JU_06805 [Candidatus Binatia bacterium]
MEILKATLWIYRVALLRSAQLVAENWLVVLAPLAYGVILSVASVFFIPLGFMGGMLLVLTSNACMSSGLYLIENILKARKADFNDFIRGFTVYLWEIVRISFILWIPMMVASTVLYRIPNGPLILLFIQITLYVILNAVPELIYQSRVSGLELLAASYNFITENWPEWFTPNLFITVAGFSLVRVLSLIARALPVSVQIFALAFILGLFLTYLMIFRGILFSELNGSNRRGRVYRYKLRD